MYLPLIFVGGFLSVFMLGFQSRNVNHGNFGWAAVTSFAVAISQTFLWGSLLKNLNAAGALTYGLSGAAGITSAMYVHRRWVSKGK